MDNDTNATARSVRVRPVTAADAADLRALRLEALRLNPVALTADLAEAEAQPAAYWEDLAARSGGGGKEVIVVADAGGGGLAGMAGVYTAKAAKLAHSGTVWGVYVRERFRGQAVGERLVRACVEWARSAGLLTLKLWVADGNAPAIRCYERCGFVRHGVEPMAVKWEGKFYDELHFWMRL